MGRVLHIGSHPAVRAALKTAFGREPEAGPLSSLTVGDTVCLEAFAEVAGRDDLPGGNVWSAAKACKDRRGVATFVVVRADDPAGASLARFVQADGCLVLQADGELRGTELLTPRDHGKQGRALDALLARFGTAFGSANKNSQALSRLLEWEGADSCLAPLQDEETGLLGGPYAALKLDEEYRRAMRFHVPLSVVLLDIGAEIGALPDGPDRRSILAEVAAVFLNECRDIDILGRFTATTFLFLLPGTPPDGAAVLARRMLGALRERQLPRKIAPVAGVASVPDRAIPDRKGLLLVAEACMQRAKQDPGLGGLCTSWE